MGSEFHEIDCGYDEPVVLERTSGGRVVLHNFDVDTELAAQELGFEQSPCYRLWKIISDTSGDPAALCANRLSRRLVLDAAHGRTGSVELFLLAGADPRHSRSMALRFAAHRGHPAVVELLLAAGADIPESDALFHASEAGCAEVVELLLAAGAGQGAAAQASAERALLAAARYGKNEVIKLLVAANVPRNAAALLKDKKLLFALAIHRNDAVLVRRLLSAGTTPTDADYNRAYEVGRATGDYTIAKIIERRLFSDDEYR